MGPMSMAQLAAVVPAGDSTVTSLVTLPTLKWTPETTAGTALITVFSTARGTTSPRDSSEHSARGRDSLESRRKGPWQVLRPLLLPFPSTGRQVESVGVTGFSCHTTG